MFDVGFILQAYGNRVASNRYRTASPIIHMGALGVKTGVGSGFVNIVCKSTDRMLRSQLENIKEKGHKIILDFCDLHTDKGHFQHEQMTDLADGIVCNTTALRLEVQKRYPAFTGPYFIIEDPYEHGVEAPADLPGNGQRLLWYGHCSHVHAINSLIEAKTLSGFLYCITNDQEESTKFYWPRNQIWSQKKVLDGLAWADIVLLPTDTDAQMREAWPFCHVKGANRLVEAVRRGRYAINDGVVESYKDYGMWSGDIPEGIAWVRANPEEALDQVRKAQSIVRIRNDPFTIARQWIAACKAVGGKLWHWTEPMSG